MGGWSFFVGFDTKIASQTEGILQNFFVVADFL